MEDFEFVDKLDPNDEAYFRKVFADTEILKVHLQWNFDEQQADPFHHNFTSQEFVRRLKRLIGITV